MTERKPGLPSADAVRAHAERWPCSSTVSCFYPPSGLWRFVGRGMFHPIYVRLLAVDGEVRNHVLPGDDEHMDDDGWQKGTWHPCTPDGRDVADAEALEERCHSERQAANACADDSAEIDRLRAAVEAERFSAHLERASAIMRRRERDEARAELAAAQAEVERLKTKIAYLEEGRAAGEEASRHRGWARRWKALARWLWKRRNDWRSSYDAAHTTISRLHRECAALDHNYAELLERWKDEQRRRIAAEAAQKSRGLLVELILAGEPAATAAFRAAAETLEARLALRTLGANLAMAGILATIQSAAEMHAKRARLEWAQGNDTERQRADIAFSMRGGAS